MKSFYAIFKLLYVSFDDAAANDPSIMITFIVNQEGMVSVTQFKLHALFDYSAMNSQ